MASKIKERQMQPMHLFIPHEQAWVYDQLNDKWVKLSADMVEHWKRTSPELEKDGTSNWDGLIITGWLPPGEAPL